MNAIEKTGQVSTLAVVPQSQRAMIAEAAFSEDTEQRKLLAKYVESHMVKDTDYGVIPGTKKPTLLKPGAEKLTDLFRCTAKYKLLEKIEDWDKGFFHYLFRCQVVARDTGAVLAEGFGSANSKEGRYRWREQQRSCPKCGKPTIIKGKVEFGGGFVCWSKAGGACGAKFKDDDASITGQPVGKVENDDIYTLANTILKMGKKRALVDGAIAIARCSDMFTQDVEDMTAEEPPAPKNGAKARAAAKVAEIRKPGPIVDVRDGETETQAKARVEEPPHDEETGEVIEEPVCPWGKEKGVPLSKCSAQTLQFLAHKLPEGLEDPLKARYRAANEALLDAVRGELARRG